MRAFGFEKRSDHRTPDGSVAHADLRFGNSVIGVSSTSTSAPDSPWAQTRQGLYVRVDDPDGYHDRAKAAGAEIVVPLKDMDYGSRDFSLRDVGGKLWGFGTYDMGATDSEPTVYPEMRYGDAAGAVRWLERAIGFTTTMEISASARNASPASSGETAPKRPHGREGGPDRNGDLMHAELRLGQSVLMLGPESPATSEFAGTHQLTHLRVDEPDAHFERTKAAGATVAREPQTAPYGARFYAARDPEGFLWWVSNYAPVKNKQASG
jgi:uncharacterized glyoxalase superfamily protein PhnB